MSCAVVLTRVVAVPPMNDLAANDPTTSVSAPFVVRATKAELLEDLAAYLPKSKDERFLGDYAQLMRWGPKRDHLFWLRYVDYACTMISTAFS
jgi:hypothetical protein